MDNLWRVVVLMTPLPSVPDATEVDVTMQAGRNSIVTSAMNVKFQKKSSWNLVNWLPCHVATARWCLSRQFA
jgi:hypothetical protein